MGINTYNPDPQEKVRLQAVTKGPTVPRKPVIGTVPRGSYINLDGAESDAELMKDLLVGRFGFEEKNIVLLKSQQATANAILTALQKELVDDAKPGDIAVFYFSGHGSLIKNKGSREIDGLDQTLVPADNWRGTPDIRDKELARIFRRAAQKGVKLTVIADSCHSGSIARGLWNPAGKVREEPPSAGYVDDPPDADKTGKPLPDPEEMSPNAVLVLSAAQRNESALEILNDKGEPHGALTWALAKALETSPPKERVDRIFERTRALIKANGLPQEPVLAGKGRETEDLFGEEADSVDGTTAAALSISDDGTIRLQGGEAIGLSVGCQLKRLKTSANDPGVEIEITRVKDLVNSEAKIVEGAAAAVRQGDLFQLDRWVVPPEKMLHVYVPPSLPLQKLRETMAALEPLRHNTALEWIDDPKAEDPSYVMSWNAKSWMLEQNPATTPPIDLGPQPTAAAVLKELRGKAKPKFLLLVPPASELTGEIRLGATSPNPGIAVETSAIEAQYVLFGRLGAEGVEYAWGLRDETDEQRRIQLNTIGDEERNGKEAALPRGSAMPLRTDWIALSGQNDSLEQAGHLLTDLALKTGRIRAWVELEAPPDQGRGSFPYHLQLEEVSTKREITGGSIREGEQYKLFLSAYEADFKRITANGRISQRWVYVFVIDKTGKGTLLFPLSGRGTEGNHLPVIELGKESPMAFPLTREDYDFDITPPFGTDTYIMLASDVPIPDPHVFELDPVLTKGELAKGSDAADPLTALLSEIGSGKARGVGTRPVPANWCLDRLEIQSVPKK